MAAWDAATTTWVWAVAIWAAWTAGATTCAAWQTAWMGATWQTAVAVTSPWAAGKGPKLLAAMAARVLKQRKGQNLSSMQLHPRQGFQLE